jgi:hypothetical protein
MRTKERGVRRELIIGGIILVLLLVVGAYIYLGTQKTISITSTSKEGSISIEGNAETGANVPPSLENMCEGLQSPYKESCLTAAQKLGPLISSKYIGWEVTGVKVGKYNGKDAAGFYLKKIEENKPSRLLLYLPNSEKIEEVNISR